MKITKKEFLKSVKKHDEFGKKAKSKWESSTPNRIKPFLRLMFEMNYGAGAKSVNCKLKSINISKLKKTESDSDKNRGNINRIKREIKSKGLTEPILIDKLNFIKNGHHRVIALKELGYTNVIAFVPTSKNVYGKNGVIENYKDWISNVV